MIELNEAINRRDAGMAQAEAHAVAEIPDWKNYAGGFLKGFASRHEFFMAEDVVALAESCGADLPPDGRAWGAVFRRAAVAGLIVKHGYAPAKTSNCSPKVMWKSLIYQNKEVL